MSNYRPITNLRFLSKVVEKVVASQISDYVELNELLPSVQSAYRRGHSVETALCKLYNDLLMYVDSGKMAIMVQLDQSCAFDVLDFSILLQRLKNRYVITGKALQWLSSYLRGRSVRVKVSDSVSGNCNIECGVPQGSTIGPLLYILYIGPLYDIAKKYNLDTHMYADDLLLVCTFKPGVDYQSQVKILEECLCEIKLWLSSNFLKLNTN